MSMLRRSQDLRWRRSLLFVTVKGNALEEVVAFHAAMAAGSPGARGLEGAEKALRSSDPTIEGVWMDGEPGVPGEPGEPGEAVCRRPTMAAVAALAAAMATGSTGERALTAAESMVDGAKSAEDETCRMRVKGASLGAPMVEAVAGVAAAMAAGSTGARARKAAVPIGNDGARSDDAACGSHVKGASRDAPTVEAMVAEAATMAAMAGSPLACEAVAGGSMATVGMVVTAVVSACSQQNHRCGYGGGGGGALANVVWGRSAWLGATVVGVVGARSQQYVR